MQRVNPNKTSNSKIIREHTHVGQCITHMFNILIFIIIIHDHCANKWKKIVWEHLRSSWKKSNWASERDTDPTQIIMIHSKCVYTHAENYTLFSKTEWIIKKNNNNRTLNTHTMLHGYSCYLKLHAALNVNHWCVVGKWASTERKQQPRRKNFSHWKCEETMW